MEIAEMDRRMLKLNRDLGELTRELQKANAELDRLNRVKNQFLGMATHDLRKPLSLIVGFAELLEEEGGDRLSPRDREYVEKILSWADRMKRLVDDFLDVSAIEAGRLKLEMARVEPGTLMAEVGEAARPKAEERGIEIRIVETPDLPTLRGDPDKLHQVLLNLVFNAVEASPDDTPVEVTAEREEDELSFSIRDQGVGMDQEDLHGLFTPFGTTKARKAGGGRGTGLGLIIAREIAEAHGGRINVASRPGEGSTFTVALPLDGPPGGG
jgi:signal transduction histidine kinase